MLTLAELTGRFPRSGRVEQILLRPARKSEMVRPPQADVTEAGLAGDHARAGKRALTLLQAEHLPVIAALAGRTDLAPDLLRRNLVVSGLNLSATRGRQLLLGTHVVIEITGPCAPCSRMEEALGEGGYNAMRGHGGWCATVLQSGSIQIGDPVTVLPPSSR